MTKIFFKEWTVKGAYPHFSDFFSEKEFEDSFKNWLEKKSEIVAEPHDGFNRKYFSNLFSKTLYYRSNELLQAIFSSKILFLTTSMSSSNLKTGILSSE